MTAVSEPLSDTFGYGLAAARPAAGIRGRVYYATDTTTLSRDNGTTWDTLTLGGGGAALTVEEADGSPTDSAVTKLVFPSGTLGITGHVATYTPTTSASSLGSWNYSRTRGGTPSDKGLRLSANIAVGVANSFRIDDNDITGADRSPYLALLAVGDSIFVDDQAGNIARAVITSAPIDNGTWWEFPFTPSGAYPMSSEPANGSNVTFGWQAASSGGGSGGGTGSATAFIGCRLTLSTQTIPNAAWTAVLMPTEVFDTDGFHSTSVSTSRITIPAGLGGRYLVGVEDLWDGDTGSNTGSRYLTVYKNGANESYNWRAVQGSTDTGHVRVIPMDLAAGDYLEMMVYQDSGGNKDIQGGLFWAYKLDSGKVGAGIGARVYKSGTQTLTSGAETTITFDSEDFDTDGFHNTGSNTDRLTVPPGLGGKYLAVGNISISGGAGGNVREMTFYKNATVTTVADWIYPPNGSGYSRISGAAVLDLVPGDYVVMKATQDSGGNRTVDAGYPTNFSLMRLDSGSVGQGPGYEYDYAQITSPVSITATTEAASTTIITGVAKTFDGTTIVMVEFYADYSQPAVSIAGSLVYTLWDGSTDLGIIALHSITSSGDPQRVPIQVARRLTPSAGSHTYSVRAYRDGGNGTLGAGVGGAGGHMPAFLRITKV